MFGFFRPRCPVDAREQAWIDLQMQWLGERFGREQLRQAEVALPTGQYFPLPYNGTEDEAREIFARICQYMREDPASLNVQFFVEDQSATTQPPAEWIRLSGTVLLYQPGTEDHGPTLHVEQALLADLEALIAYFAVGLSAHRLLREQLIASTAEEFLPRAELGPIWWGLGIFSANAVLRETAVTQGLWFSWAMWSSGSLTARHHGYALALAARMRGETNPQWSRYLRRDAEAALKDGLKYLQKTDDALVSPDGPVLDFRSLAALQTALRNGSDSRRIAALWAVRDLPDDALKREAVPAVAENLRHTNALVRQEAVGTLDVLGPLASDQLPEMVVALSDSSASVRRAAAFACGHQASHPELVLPELLPVLKDVNLTTASAAAWAVGQYGKTACDAVPALVRLARMGAVKCEAVFVDEVLESLVAVCDDPEAAVAEQLAERDEESCRRVLDTLAAWRVRAG